MQHCPDQSFLQLHLRRSVPEGVTHRQAIMLRHKHQPNGVIAVVHQQDLAQLEPGHFYLALQHIELI